MKLPSNVRVSYITYKIEELPLSIAAALSRHGDCDHSEALIRVQLKYHSPQQQSNTLFHEISHAIFYLYDISIESEEAIITGMANGWCQVKQDNPGVEKFINGGLNGCK